MDKEFSHTKGYEVSSGTIDLGRSYEYKMVTLISLQCLAQDYYDVEIAFNAADLGAWDDVVINAWTKAGDNIKILLQLKHEDTGKNITREQFVADKGNYTLSKYCDHIRELKKHLDCKSSQTGIIKDLENDGCDAISFLNTNTDNNNLYKFDLKKVSELSSLPEIDYNIYLFAKQSHVNHLEELIESEMVKVFEHFGLTHYSINNDDNIRIVSKAFIEYVTDWSMGKLGRHHYLTKHAILYKLTELLLKQYELNLSREKFEFYDCSQRELWNEVVNDKKITIVASHEEVIRFLKLYVGTEIRPYCQELGKTWSSKYSNAEQSWFYGEYEQLKKAMLKVVGRNGKITLLSIYKCLWFNECLPLLLKINTSEDYEVILRILKLSEFKLKVVILTKVKLKPTGIELDYFATLTDLNNEKRLKILNNPIKLQGRSPVALKKLVDDSLYPLINCNAIINILMGNFNIGIPYEPLSECFINRSFLKVFLEMRILNEVQDEIFVITIKEETDHKSVRSKLEEFTCNTNVIIVDEHSPMQREELKFQNKSVHRLVFDQNNLLEWKESLGSINSINTYRIRHQINFSDYLFYLKYSPLDTSPLCYELKDVLAGESADNCFSRVNVISASPGMGKLTLLDHIASIASTEMWVLNVNLSDHDEYYDGKQFKKGELTAQDHLEYFNDSILENHKCNNIQLAQSVFQKFVNKKQVLVLLDAMDEVSISCKKEVVEMINSIQKAGFSVWLTTRPHLGAELEKQFSTISTTLRPFSIDDQKRFLNIYFKQIGDIPNVPTNQTLIEQFVEELLQASRNNLNDRNGEFTGIPLQTKLLANAFSDDLKQSLRSGILKFEVRFDLLHLYEEFMKRKDNIFRDKFGKGAKDMQTFFKNHQQLIALKLIFKFGAVDLFRLDIEEKLNDYYNNNKEHIQFLQQDGVTVIQRNVNKKQKLKFHFVHRTFAEYLAAQWLFNHFNGGSDNSKLTARLLLRRRYTMYSTVYGLLFRMFDCMVARDSPLHLSIINGRLDEALELIKLNPDVRDKCGRTFVHIIPHYETVHYSYNSSEGAEFIDQIPAEEIKNIRDILGYTPLDYALVNRSWSFADKLCEKSKELTISTNMLNFDDIYCDFQWLTNPKYKTLLQITLPPFICQKLLSGTLNHDTNIANYCMELFRCNNKGIEIINEYMNELGVTTISDLLEKINIKSVDVAQTYYYDLSFAAAFGSILNVQDLILSEYWIKQNNFDTPLYWAIRHNRLEIVKLLIFYGGNINEPCMQGKTALHCAAQHGYIEIVSELLSHQADVNLQTNESDTPLNLAILDKHVKTAKLLLAHGARVDLKDYDNCFPVYYAALRGLDDLIPDLLKGVDVNHRGHYDESPLLTAICYRHVSTVQMLLRYGADCNTPDNSNKFPIHSVTEVGLDEVLPEIVCKTLKGINVRTINGETALHLSIHWKLIDFPNRSSNRTNIVKFLLNNGADPNIQDNKGNTPLHYLCNECPLGDKDRNIVAGLLVGKGGDVRLKNNKGNTPLLSLLQILYNSDIPGSFSSQIAHEPDFPGYFFEIFPFLIHKDNVNVQDKNGNTALHYLFEASTLPIDNRKSGAELVLNKGADVNIKNNNGKSALHLFLHYLFTHDVMRQLFEIFPLVICKANVNLQDNKGNTALHYLLEVSKLPRECREIGVRLLLNKGADVNIINNDGDSCLYRFLRCFFIQNRFSLLTRTANANIQNNVGNQSHETDKKIINLLLQNGADLNLKNKDGDTPLYLALRGNLIEIVSLFQQH